MIRYYKMASVGKGDITHDDWEVEGLGFRINHKMIVKVWSNEVKTLRWKEKDKEKKTDATDIEFNEQAILPPEMR